MKLFTVFLTATSCLALLPLAARANIERSLEKKFSVQPAGALKVETSGGKVELSSSGESEVKVIAKIHFKTDSEGEADDLMKNFRVEITQENNNVSAIAERIKNGLLDWSGNNRIWVDFIVTVPTRFDANLKTSGGDVKVGDLTGEIRARTSGGDIKFGRIAGPIDAATSGGSITLKESTGKAVLSTSGGDVHVMQAGAEAELTTSGGNIVVDHVEDGLKAITSGGNVTAVFTGSLKSESELRTSGGDVKATVDSSSGFRLDAKTSGGAVKVSGLTLAEEKVNRDKSHVEGSANGGGAVLKLRTSGGNVVVVGK